MEMTTVTSLTAQVENSRQHIDLEVRHGKETESSRQNTGKETLSYLITAEALHQVI